MRDLVFSCFCLLVLLLGCEAVIRFPPASSSSTGGSNNNHNNSVFDVTCNCSQSFPSGLVELQVTTYPGTLQSPNSYVNVIVSAGGKQTQYPAWCSDVAREIYENTNYAAVIISSFDPQLAEKLAALGIRLQLGNLTRANYLLSQYANRQLNAAVTYGDVQTAIWYLLQNPGSIDTDPTAPYVSSHVANLLTTATNNGSCYQPQQSHDVYVAFIVPVGQWPYAGSTTHMQITNQLLLLQVTVSEQRPCFKTFANHSTEACLPLSKCNRTDLYHPSSSSTGHSSTASSLYSSSSSSSGRTIPSSSSSSGIYESTGSNQLSSSSSGREIPSTSSSGSNQLPNTCNCEWSLTPSTADLMVIKYPGTDLTSSYIDITLKNTASQLCGKGKTCEFSAWCSDTSREIDQNINYAADLVSSYNGNLSRIFASYGVQINLGNVTAVNYMLNNWAQNKYAKSKQITWGDIQTALWKMLQIPGSIDTDSSAPYTQSHVNFLISDAVHNGQCYVPRLPVDQLTIFIVPVGLWASFQPRITNQLLLMQVSLQQFPLFCYESTNRSKSCAPNICNTSPPVYISSSSSSSSTGKATSLLSSSSTGTNKPVTCRNCTCVCCSNSTVTSSAASENGNSSSSSSQLSKQVLMATIVSFFAGALFVMAVYGLYLWNRYRRTKETPKGTKQVSNPHRRRQSAATRV